jgi:hypothetical protein
MNPNGSEAYRWILENTADLLETPDEGFDWIFMLKNDDWQRLCIHWNQLSVDAKVAIAYIVCYGPAIQSREMVLQALHDENAIVARQSAESLNNQRKLYGEDFPPLDSESEQLIALLAAEDET